jgi:asparagine synthase (glutamine-hydrolysing)
VAGIFGRGAGAAAADIRRSLGQSATREVAAPLALGWTGDVRAPGVRTLLLAGRVHNLDDLAADLGAKNDVEPGHVVAHAFDRWGEGALAKLRGGFVIVLWNPVSTRGLIAVDQLGVGGLFVHESGGRLSFSTELDHLVRLLARQPAPASRSVAQWLGDGYLARGDTLLEGVGRLEGGHLLRLANDRWEKVCYWAPRYVAPDQLPPSEAGAQLKAELMRSVRRRVATQGATGVLVSGGLDSSTVAALARGLDSAPTELRAYSLVYPDHPELDESALIDQVTRTLGLPSERMAIRGASALSSAFEFQLAWGLPPTTPMLAFNTSLLRRAAQDGIAVMLDGEGGDELFGCSEYLIADRLRRGDVRGAVRLAKRLPGVGHDPQTGLVWMLLREYGAKGAAPHVLHRTLRRVFGAKRYAPDWLKPAVARCYLEARDEWAWKQHAGPRWWAYLADLLTAWRERMGAHDLLRRRAALAGVESAHPLLDDLDVIELVLRLPPELGFDPELTRPLVRQAVSGLLPDEIRLRPDKIDFSPLLIEALSGRDWPLTVELLGASDAELRAYVEQSSVRRLLEVPADRRNVEWARLVARLATTESWLRSQADPEFPQRLLERLRPSLSDEASG